MLTRRSIGALVLGVAIGGCGGSTAPPTPTTVVAASSVALTGTVGTAVTPLPSVTVTGSNGSPVSNVAVVFAIGGGGGSLTGGSATTNSSGVATVGSWTLGPLAGENTMTATVAAITPPGQIVFAATAAAGPAAKLVLAQAPSGAAADRVPLAVQPAVQLQDANGNKVAQAGVSITASISSGGGTLGGTATATTAATGIATFTNLSIGGTIGAKTLSFSGTGLTSVSAQTSVTVGAASAIAINAGNSQSAPAGNVVATAPSAIVTDADANPVSGVLVRFVVASGGGTVTGGTQTTNASGIASVTSWTLGSATGANTLTASSAGLSGSPATFSATATANSAALAYGGSSDKLVLLDPTGSYTPTITITSNGNAQAASSATYTSRATSVATVDANGKLTAVAAGESWVVASYAGLLDSVFVQVTRSAAGPELRADLTTYITHTGNVITVNFTLDPRTTTVGSALVAIGFETENGMFSLGTASVPSQPAAQPAESSAQFGVYRSTVAAAAGLTAPAVMLQLQLTA